MTIGSANQKAKPMSPVNSDQRAREPSMEDILASIRRIIADDQLQAGRSGSGNLRLGPSTIPDPQESVAVDHGADFEQPHAFDEVLDLARMPESVLPDPARQPAVAVTENHDTRPSARDADEDAIQHLPEEQAPIESYVNGYASRPPYDRPVVQTVQSVAEKASDVPEPAPSARSQQLQSSGDTGDALVSPSIGASVISSFETLAATVVLQNNDMLDRIMHDLMRPLIKSWLDDNLPTLVERLVRAEIERVARGNR